MTDPLTLHEGRDPDWFDAQYNLRAGRPDYEETVIPGWIAASQAARDTLDCMLDVRYADGEKQLLDVFRCGDPTAPTLIWIHGGYWQRGDKSIYSFLATPFVQKGVNVVVVGYDLCPAVTMTRICEELREALTYVWHEAPKMGINRDRITVMGHSAGGHLTQMMMATDWPAREAALPADLIKSGIPVSPLSYLEPVRLTLALNANLRMNTSEAIAESPMSNHPPVTNASQLVVVGGAETDEFHRQSHMYQDKFATDERPIEMYVVPNVDHFDELNVLADPASPFFVKTCAMLGLKG
ncbi:arylformamidase [Sulfitobacter brevis]|uniref:Arylformamidase n=1 Tax=Sulfitobacter brevis TaxID=74348 RepID=A0A1I2HAQ5_9RHOB|nr:alpha/beta hydrolase [Sulfitobacter brevis]SFF26453.1 arylformamidase [Sulfitobacter brevis]